jgi:hypothetical protein
MAEALMPDGVAAAAATIGGVLRPVAGGSWRSHSRMPPDRVTPGTICSRPTAGRSLGRHDPLGQADRLRDGQKVNGALSVCKY